MQRKFMADDIVYNWYFELGTTNLKCQELTVYRWDYMDGMQWEVIDEYMLMKEVEVPIFPSIKMLSFMTKKKQTTVRLPGYLLGDTKEYAKFMAIAEMVDCFGYALKKEDNGFVDEGTLRAVQIANTEYNEMLDLFPEIALRHLGEFRPDKTNHGWLWR